MKSSAIAPANIAFIKYWGRKDHKIFLPLSTTNSMNLSNCLAHTTFEFDENIKTDSIIIIDSNKVEKEIKKESGGKNTMLFRTLDRIRDQSGTRLKARVVSELTFPLGAGIASSAAGMAAFVASGFMAAGMEEKVNDIPELSREIRLSGSASAARSAADGFTELLYGESHEQSFVRMIAPPDHWDIIDLVAVVDSQEKSVTSSEGHEVAETSPFFNARVEYLKEKPDQARKAILDKDFATLAELSEVDSINMHAIMMTSTPPAFYFAPGSIVLIHKIRQMRADGVAVFFTFDAGANAHIICTKEHLSHVKREIEALQQVKFVIENSPCVGVRIVDKHLF